MLITNDVNLNNAIENLRAKVATYDSVMEALKRELEEMSHDRSSSVSSAGTSSGSMDSLDSVIIQSKSVEEQIEVVKQKRKEVVDEPSLHYNLPKELSNLLSQIEVLKQKRKEVDDELSLHYNLPKELSTLLSQKEDLIKTLCEKAGKSRIISRTEIDKSVGFAESLAGQSDEYDHFRYKHSASYEYFARMHLQTPQDQRPPGASFFSLTHLLIPVKQYDSKISVTLHKLAQIDPDLSDSIKEELAQLDDTIQKKLVALEKGQDMTKSVSINSNSLFSRPGSLASSRFPAFNLGLSLT